MKILIVGKPFIGKTALENALENKFNLKVAKSTDIPSEISFASRITPLGTQYVSEADIKNNDVIEVHPNEVKRIMEHFPKEYFFICYLKADDADRKKFVVTTKAEEEIWNKTESLNQKAYECFEEMVDNIAETTKLPSNGGNGINVLACSFSKHQAEEFASDIKRSYTLYHKAVEALTYLIDIGLIVGNTKEGLIESKDGKPISMYQYAMQVAHNPEDFGNLMMDYFHAETYPKDLL